MNKALEGLVGLAGGIAAAVMPVTIDRTVNPAYAQSASPGTCVVNGRSLNNCIDLVYQRAEAADEIYPGAKRILKNDRFATRFNFIYFTNWDKAFFEGKKSQDIQRALQEDAQVNYHVLFGLFDRLRGKIERVTFTKEGFMTVAERDTSNAYIIRINPDTADKINMLYEGKPL